MTAGTVNGLLCKAVSRFGNAAGSTGGALTWTGVLTTVEPALSEEW